jgi:hypothetical protein
VFLVRNKASTTLDARGAAESSSSWLVGEKDFKIQTKSFSAKEQEQTSRDKPAK